MKLFRLVSTFQVLLNFPAPTVAVLSQAGAFDALHRGIFVEKICQDTLFRNGGCTYRSSSSRTEIDPSRFTENGRRGPSALLKTTRNVRQDSRANRFMRHHSSNA